jgi:hypothetical protein
VRLLDALTRLASAIVQASEAHPRGRQVWQRVLAPAEGDSFLESLTGDIVDTYAQLRRLDEVVSIILQVLLDHKGDVRFADAFMRRYANCVRGLPHGSTAALWTLFLNDLRTNHLCGAQPAAGER